MGFPAPVAGMAGIASSPAAVAASAISCLLFTSFFISGQAEGFSLAAAKDASRFITTSTAVPSRFESYQPDFRGIKAAMQATNAEGQYALSKQHHQYSHHDTISPPSPDFERQLEQLKESHTSPDSEHLPPPQKPAPVPSVEEPPVAPISRKDELFTPGLGVEEVSFLGPIRKLGEEGEEGSGDRGAAIPGEVAPLQPDLLESEADVLEELKKLSSVHDAVMDPLLQLRPEPLSPVAGEGVAVTEQPPMRLEKARIVGIGGATGDHFLLAGERDDEDGDDDDDDEDDEDDEDDLEDELEEEDEADKRQEEVTTQDPEKEVISLEERLSASLRELAKLRRKQSHQAPDSSPTKPAPSLEDSTLIHSQVDLHAPSGSGTAISDPVVETAPPPVISTPGVEAPMLSSGGREIVMESKRSDSEGRGPSQRAAMRKAHMARKLMDPEDPKKDEDLLELMLRIAENPDEWKRVHSLLRQLDDDLTTYEKTMHRVQALATHKSTSSVVPLSQKEMRREEMSRSGLPAGLHGEAPASTTTTITPTQHPPSLSSQGPITSHHKDWPKFAYHRVTSAPLSDPFLLLQQQQQQQHHEKDGPSPAPYPPSPSSMHRHRNAYIAVSVITPPSARGNKQSSSGAGRPLPSPPPVHAAPPTHARHIVTQSTTTEPPAGNDEKSRGDVRLVAEETLHEPMMGEEEVVDRVVSQESSMHRQMHHQDQVEEQLRALAAVEEKLRHQLHEKERMRHLLKEVGAEEGTKHHRKSKRSIKETAQHQRHLLEGDHIAFKTS